jgi:hypothetical protein
MPLEEYELVISTQQFAIEKAIEAEHIYVPNYRLMFVMYVMDVI